MHVGDLAGHYGRNKTIKAVEHKFYWPSLKSDVAKIVVSIARVNWLNNKNILLGLTLLSMCPDAFGKT